MRGERVIGWFERLERFYQLLVIIGFLLGIVGAMLSATAWACIVTIDYRVSRQVYPLAMMMEFQFEKYGLDGEFESFKAKREKQHRAFGEFSLRPSPELWQRAN